MAAGDSVTSICNIGLIAIGEDPVVSVFPPDNTKRAILCSQRYDQIRRAILRSAPWNCAKKQAQLATTAGSPLFTYANAYQLPGDFVRMFNLPENDGAIWEVISNQLLTDEGAPLDVVYIRDLQDPAAFDPLLTEAIGYAVGAALARPLGQSKTLHDELAVEVEGKLSSARLAGSQENSPREWDEDVWLRQRR